MTEIHLGRLERAIFAQSGSTKLPRSVLGSRAKKTSTFLEKHSGLLLGAGRSQACFGRDRIRRIHRSISRDQARALNQRADSQH
jgi:hypothetical protein